MLSLSAESGGISCLRSHTRRVLVDTTWRHSPPLTAAMENPSLASMGDPAPDSWGHPWN